MSNGSNKHWGLTVLRVIVGCVFLAHGAQKIFVFGFHGTAGAFAGMGIPAPAVTSAIVALVELLVGVSCLVRPVWPRRRPARKSCLYFSTDVSDQTPARFAPSESGW